MTNLSRRSFVGAVAAGAAAGAAGCTDGVGGLGGGNDRPAYSRWLSAELLGDVEEAAVIHVDFQHVLAEWPEEARQELDVEEEAAALGLEADDLDDMLMVSRGGGLEIESDIVFTGSFDVDDVVESLAMGMETEEYEGYEVIMGSVAIDSGAIVASQAYRELIDTRDGEADRLADVDDRWDDVLRNVSGVGFSMISLDPYTDAEIVGVAMEAQNGSIAVTVYSHFADEQAAEEGLETAEAEIEDQLMDDVEVTDTRVEDTVVVVEGVIEDFEW